MKRISRFCLAAAACTLLAACTSGTYQSDRKPYDGFRWGHISGAGLDLWAQTSDRLRIVTDSSLPAGAYGDSIDAQMMMTPVPSTCSGWGIGNSGMRYFETFAKSPGRILFVNIGQEQPLFDEASIKLQR